MRRWGRVQLTPPLLGVCISATVGARNMRAVEFDAVSFFILPCALAAVGFASAVIRAIFRFDDTLFCTILFILHENRSICLIFHCGLPSVRAITKPFTLIPLISRNTLLLHLQIFRHMKESGGFSDFPSLSQVHPSQAVAQLTE